MRKFLFVLAMIIAVASSASARYTTRIDYHDCSGCCPTTAGYMGPFSAATIFFFDESGCCYMTVDILCDGGVVEQRWNNSLGPIGIGIGQIPVWAYPFNVAEPEQASDGWTHVQILSGGFLAATIDFDEIAGHDATVTTYPNPFE